MLLRALKSLVQLGAIATALVACEFSTIDLETSDASNWVFDAAIEADAGIYCSDTTSRKAYFPPEFFACSANSECIEAEGCCGTAYGGEPFSIVRTASSALEALKLAECINVGCSGFADNRVWTPRCVDQSCEICTP